MVVETQLYDVLESFLDKGNKKKTVDFDAIFTTMLARSDKHDFEHGRPPKWEYDKESNILYYSGWGFTGEGLDFLGKQHTTIWCKSTKNSEAAVKRDYLNFTGPTHPDKWGVVSVSRIICSDISIDTMSSDISFKGTTFEMHPRGSSRINAPNITLDGVTFESDSTHTNIHFETTGKMDVKNTNFDVKGSVSFRFTGDEMNKLCKKVGKMIEKGQIDNPFKEFGIDLDSCKFNGERGVSIDCPKSGHGNSWPTIWMKPKQAKGMFTADHNIVEYKDWIFFFKTTKKSRW